jgi:hypothetical protein
MIGQENNDYNMPFGRSTFANGGQRDDDFHLPSHPDDLDQQ